MTGLPKSHTAQSRAKYIPNDERRTHETGTREPPRVLACPRPPSRELSARAQERGAVEFLP